MDLNAAPRGINAAVACLALLWLTGCGPAGQGGASAQPNGKAQTPTPAAAHEQLVEAEAGAAAASSSGAAASCSGGAPERGSPDFWGVELGMPLEQVRGLLVCLGPEFKAREDTSGVALDGVDLRFPFIAVSRGPFGEQEELSVSFIGAKGQERVFRINKTTYYASNAPGSRQAAEKALAGKYGEFSRLEPSVFSTNTYGKVWDKGGAQITSSDPVFNICATFAVNRNRHFIDLPGRFDPRPDKCGRILSFNVSAESNVSDKLGMLVIGTLDYSHTIDELKRLASTAS